MHLKMFATGLQFGLSLNAFKLINDSTEYHIQKKNNLIESVCMVASYSET